MLRRVCRTKPVRLLRLHRDLNNCPSFAFSHAVGSERAWHGPERRQREIFFIDTKNIDGLPSWAVGLVEHSRRRNELRRPRLFVFSHVCLSCRNQAAAVNVMFENEAKVHESVDGHRSCYRDSETRDLFLQRKMRSELTKSPNSSWIELKECKTVKHW